MIIARQIMTENMERSHAKRTKEIERAAVRAANKAKKLAAAGTASLDKDNIRTSGRTEAKEVVVLPVGEKRKRKQKKLDGESDDEVSSLQPSLSLLSIAANHLDTSDDL